MIKDPVCRMEVDSKKFIFEFEGKKYYFCSQGCEEKFKNSPKKFSRRYVHDLVIIGGGPAALTASVYASVLKVDTFLVTMDIGGQAIDSSGIKNYMGFHFITGKELIKKFKAQFLHEHYLDHGIDEVVKINRLDEDFEILTKGQNRLLARAIIIATGMKRRRLGIPGENRLLRKGVSYRSVQDLALFKGSDVAVIGGGNSAVHTANDLKNLGCKVTIISKSRLRGDEADIELLKKSGKVDILEEHDLLEIQGKDKVEVVVIRSQHDLTEKKIPCRGVFIQIGLLPNTEFCRELVEVNDKGEIIINTDCSTNVKGIFACGDVTNGFGKRIIIASGEGAKAALSARRYLLQKS